MSIFHYISVCVPVTLAFAVPYVLRRHGFIDEKKYRWLLYIGDTLAVALAGDGVFAVCSRVGIGLYQ